MAMRVSVVVPAYNAAETIGETLAALASQDLAEPFEVIVVDDGSEDESVAIARRAGEPVSVVSQDNQGPGPARNRGVTEAQAEVIAFTDADCVPSRSWLREALAALRDADLVQGLVRPDPRVERRPFDRTVGVGRAGGLFECANLLVRRDLFDRVGGFEDWLQAAIGKPLAEDLWFGWRCKRAGARIAFAPEAIVDHAVFRRTLAAYVAERVRLAYFPAIAAKVPELRDDFLYRRWFLTWRSASFDLALVGIVAGGVLATVSLPAALVPLVATLPYGRSAARAALRWRRRSAKALIGDVLADAVGFAALAWGSVRWRTLVI